MFAKIYLGLNAVVIGLIGLGYLHDPNLLLARYGLETGSVGMDNMLRATYGGVSLGLAALFLMGMLKPARRRDAVGLVIIIMGSFAIGRIASMALAGTPPTSIMGLFYYEVVMTLIGLFLYIREGSPSAVSAG